ncbi:MAG: hypothetical protein R3254_04305, partial [Thiomicrorhabdus sp.]|nr:hypothetical protein [Thiomicrorhabdus sp.]
NEWGDWGYFKTSDFVAIADTAELQVVQFNIDIGYEATEDGQVENSKYDVTTLNVSGLGDGIGFYSNASGLLRLTFPLGTYATVDEAKADLSSTKYRYKVANPSQLFGTLILQAPTNDKAVIIGNENGHIAVKNYLKKVGV